MTSYLKTSTAAEAYLAAVRAELADLPVTELDEIIEDLGPQLAELAGESAESLTVQLGTPQQYAEELRSAAGFPVARDTGRPWARYALWSLVAGTGGAGYAGYLHIRVISNDAIYALSVLAICLLVGAVVVSRYGPKVDQVAALPEVRWTVATFREPLDRPLRYLESLRPGWLLLRAGLIATGGPIAFHYSPVWLFVFFVLGALSLWLGPKARADRRWVWINLPVTACAAGAGWTTVSYLATLVIYAG